MLYPEYEDSREEWKVTRALLHRIADDCREHGAELLVVVFPTMKEANRDHVSDRPGRMVAAACRDNEATNAWSGPTGAGSGTRTVESTLT